MRRELAHIQCYAVVFFKEGANPVLGPTSADSTSAIRNPISQIRIVQKVRLGV